jgi:hypothetical protein
MARCGCSSGSCSCLVVAGDGITVTGAGSQSNPFVITGTAVTVSDSATVDMTVSGSGTVASPYVLSASVNMVLDQLNDVIASSPVAGYLLTYQTSPSPGWYAAVATSGIPGATLHDGSMTGDGSASNVLAVKIDPAGGLSITSSGLFVSPFETVCLSTTHPTTPTDRMRIYESDTHARGVWDAALGLWMMYDSVPQTYTPHFGTTANNAYVGNADLYGFYMRAGLICNVAVQFHQGNTTSMGFDSVYFGLPFTAQGAPLELNDYHSGQCYIEAAGWKRFIGQPFIQPGSKRFFIYAPITPNTSEVLPLRNAYQNTNPGNSVPQRPSEYAFHTGTWIESGLTYFMKDGVT